MALQKQKIAMPLVDGIDTKGDEKTVLPTRFLELQNVVFTKPGSFVKRYGYEALERKILGTNSEITSGSALTTLNDELLIYSNNRLYSYSESQKALSDKGEIRYCNSFSTQVTADSDKILNPSSFTYNNVTCYAYEKKSASLTPQVGMPSSSDIFTEKTEVQITVVDNVSNTVLAVHNIDYKLLDPSFVDASYYSPKVSFVGSNFIIVFNKPEGYDKGLRYASIDYLKPEELTISPNILQPYAGLSTMVKHIDVCQFNNRCFVGYWNGTTVIVKSIESNLSVGNAVDSSFNVEPTNISLNKEGSNLRCVISALDGSVAKAYLFDYGLNYFVHPAVTITAPALATELQDTADGFYTITAVQTPGKLNESTILLQRKNYKQNLGYVVKAYIDSLGNLTSNGEIVQVGVEIQSKACVLEDQVYVYVAKNIDPNYSASITIDLPGSTPSLSEAINKPVRTLYLLKLKDVLSEISAQFEVDTACFVQSSRIIGLPEVYVNGLNMELPIASINSFQPINATQVLADTVIKKLTADFSQLTNYFDAEQGDSLYISGGLLKQYDGNKVVEFGFLDTPEPIKQPETADIVSGTAGPGLPGGTSVYQYCVVYKWTDRTSKVHRSAPSRAVSVALQAGTWNVHVYFTPLYITAKENVEIEIYRTQANGSVFYKLSKVVDVSNGGSPDDYLTGSYKNDSNRKFIQIRDTVFDEELAFSEPLYTTGGILENDAPLSSTFVATYKSRLFLLLSDGYTMQYSKETGLGDPVRFNAAFKILLDAKGGKATCAKAMDDHLIIFKERAIFALTGEGPLETGAQNDYRSPYLLTSDAGCIDPNSIVETPTGLIFKSQKGIYLLKRGFTLQYIGDSVEKYNNDVIVSSCLLPTVNQVRLITDKGVALVYDYYVDRWSTFTNIVGLDSIDYKGSYYYLKNDGYIMKEVKDLYMDNGKFIPMKIKSSWIQVAGVQGYQRLYKLLFLGDFLSSHKLKISLSYNFNDYVTEDTLIDTSSLDTGTYGSSTYGSGIYGGSFPLYQWRVFPKTQKCQAFQYTIEDIKTDVDGASFSLSHVHAEVGVKFGLEHAEASKSFGTK